MEVYALANIKSAKKRILVNETKAARNKAIKSKVKTAVKKVEAAVAAKDAETAKTALRAAIVEISKAGTKGVYHKKTDNIQPCLPKQGKKKQQYIKNT